LETFCLFLFPGKYIGKPKTMAAAKPSTSSSLRTKTKIKRRGVHSKKKASVLKTSKCYLKKYNSQGK